MYGQSPMEIAAKELEKLIETSQAKIKMLPGPVENALGYGADPDGQYDNVEVFNELSGVEIAYIPYGIYYTSYFPKMKDYIKADDALILLNGVTKYDDSILSGIVDGKITFQGEEPITISVTNANIVESGTFSVEYYSGSMRDASYQKIELTINISDVLVGQVIVINQSDSAEFLGAYEVIGVNGNTVTCIFLNQYEGFTSKTFSGSGFLLKTVIKYENNKTALTADKNSIITIKNIALIGNGFPYDYDGRGNNYDPSGTKNGVTGIISRDASTVELINCAVMGFSGSALAANDSAELSLTSCGISCGGRNGIMSASNSKVTVSPNTVCSSNLLDGIVSQDSSFIFSTNVHSVCNGRHGFIAAGLGAINITNSHAYYNGYLEGNGDGCNLTSGMAIAISFVSKNNKNSGAHIIGNSTLRITGADIQENEYGILAETSSQVTVNGTVNNNLTTDISALSGSFIYAPGTSFTTSYPVANNITPDKSFIQTTVSLDELRFSSNRTNTAWMVDNANRMILGFGSSVSGINARMQINGHLLSRGNLYLLGDDNQYYLIKVVGGSLNVTPTSING